MANKSPSIGKMTLRPNTKPIPNEEYSLKDFMTSLKSMHADIQSIKSKLLTQKNTPDEILARIEKLTEDINSLKNENAIVFGKRF